MPVRVAICPSCRQERITKLVGTTQVRGRTVDLVECSQPSCELVWAVRPDRHLAPAAA